MEQWREEASPQRKLCAKVQRLGNVRLDCVWVSVHVCLCVCGGNFGGMAGDVAEKRRGVQIVRPPARYQIYPVGNREPWVVFKQRGVHFSKQPQL